MPSISGRPLKILLIAEKKNPPDKRVAFTPEQCKIIEAQHPEIRFYFEASPVRCIPDKQYLAAGITCNLNPREADILFGIKEVPTEYLEPGKTYFFFSHTIKKQEHNRTLLQHLLSKKIEMIDYECLLDETGERTVAFGRFAGIVGAYNAFRLWLKKNEVTLLPAASSCRNTEELISRIRPWLPAMKGVKMAITGSGRVGKGAHEVFEMLGLPESDPEAYLTYHGNELVYTILRSSDYMNNRDGKTWDESRFRSNPEEFESSFSKFAACTDVLISCHYWNPKAPELFRLDEVTGPDFRISVISDVTCDIGGSIPTTLRASTIADPFYEVDRKSGKELPDESGSQTRSISVCAVDNLPCELPLDASAAFGEMLMKQVIPEIGCEHRPSIQGATICREGKLSPKFAYLQDFADGKSS
jgi:saccharopine dehydrogenase (NAD+, L-lysine-forming)